MVLFINPISTNIELSVIENGELRQSSTIPKGFDYDQFPEVLIGMIDRHDIDTIWCVEGPGAFTRMRIVTLSLNTVKLTRKIELKGCHFFDLIREGVPVLRANDKEYLMRTPSDMTNFANLRQSKGTMEHLSVACADIEELRTLGKGLYIGYGSKNDFTDDQDFVEWKYDIALIREVFENINQKDRLSPIYIKAPHITWSKKNISHSSEKMKK